MYTINQMVNLIHYLENNTYNIKNILENKETKQNKTKRNFFCVYIAHILNCLWRTKVTVESFQPELLIIIDTINFRLDMHFHKITFFKLINASYEFTCSCI